MRDVWMNCGLRIVAMVALILASRPAGAQDYRFRVVASVDTRPVAAASATTVRPAVSAGSAPGGTGEGWPFWLALACPLGFEALDVHLLPKFLVPNKSRLHSRKKFVVIVN